MSGDPVDGVDKAALTWSWRDPKSELLFAITRGQTVHALPVNDAAALVALIGAQPRPPRADHLELYVTRDGKEHRAAGTLFFETWDEARAARDWEHLKAQPGDVLHAALFGWTCHSVMTAEWVLRADLHPAPGVQPPPVQEGDHGGE